MKNTYKVPLDEQKKFVEMLGTKHDFDSERIKRYLSMPDLSRTKGSPINDIVEKIIASPDFKDLDVIEVPEIVRADISFDLFDFPADHPARSKSDTYYVDDKHILRTHTTVMWYYYLLEPEVKKKMAEGKPVGCFSYGKVYRKDEIDRNHMNVFHQIDGWYLVHKDEKTIGIEDLQNALISIAKAVYGPDVKYRFNEDTFPYTHPSLEMEIEKNGKWLEVLGSGVVKGSVLEKFGIDSSIWTGWAFGQGIERLAMVSMELPDIRLLWSDDERVKKQLVLGQTFKEVSKFPSVVRDISFVVSNKFIPNDYFDRIREVGEGFVEEVELLDKYENVAKFGEGKLSYTFRITYRRLDRTLTNAEVNDFHSKIEEMTTSEFGGSIRLV